MVVVQQALPRCLQLGAVRRSLLAAGRRAAEVVVEALNELRLGHGALESEHGLAPHEQGDGGQRLGMGGTGVVHGAGGIKGWQCKQQHVSPFHLC